MTHRFTSAEAGPRARHPGPPGTGGPGWRQGLRRLLNLLLALAAAYAGLLALVWWAQERLLFFPQTLPAHHRFDFGPDVQETWVEVPGARLNALHLRLPKPDGVVFFLHGNAGSLQGWFGNLAWYRQINHDLFMIDYRGYGKSTGRISSQAQLQADVAAAWAQIAPQYAGRQRVFLGRSLGTGLAAALAAEVQPEATVLVSPYVSIAALAREHYPFIPGALLRYPLRTDEALPRIAGRVLLVHGLRDTLIPPSHSQRLLALQPAAEALWLPEAGHNDLQDHAAYRAGMAAWIRQGPLRP